MDFPYISIFPYNCSLIFAYFAPFWAGPPCRPAGFFFEGPRAPYGSGRGAPDGAPQKKIWPAGQAGMAGRPPIPYFIPYSPPANRQNTTKILK